MKKNALAFLAAFAVVSPASAETAVVKIRSTAADAAPLGVLTLADAPGGLRVTGTLSGLPPGAHGFHIHEFGDCGDAGKAAGGHYNPRHAPHGDALKDGIEKAHAGDLGNVVVDAGGGASIDVTLPGVSVAKGRLSVAGRAFIIHEKADDFSQPAGNAGGRIGCGPILIAAAPK
jgi:Cu-Zn family superoxide dismutase